MTKLYNFLIYLFIFLLPWQTRLILRRGFLNGAVWEYGIIGIYAEEVLLWLILLAGILNKRKKNNWLGFLKNNRVPISALAILLFVSGIVSGDKLVFFQQALHLLEAGAFFILLSSGAINNLKAAYCFVLGLLPAAFLGIYQFLSQNTFASRYLGLTVHHSGTLGTAVLENGGRWLRAYGTFTHPNALGAFLALGLIICFLLIKERNDVVGVFKKSGAGILFFNFIFLAALFFSFSRSAWLALAVSLFFWFFRVIKKNFSPFIRRRLILNFSFSLIFLALLSVIFLPLLRNRVEVTGQLEEWSKIQRLNGYTESYQNNIFWGTGLGNYTLVAAQKFSLIDKTSGYQPVHNALVLVFIELGITGTILLIIFLFFLLKKNKLGGEILLFFLILSLFDHYLWSSFSGLMLLALGLGVWNFGGEGVLGEPSDFMKNNYFKKIFNSILEKLSYFFNFPLSKPKGSDLIITYNCNFRCSHCDIWKCAERNELNTVEWKKIISDLRKWVGPGYLISLGGGEPLIRPDILEILNFLKINDFRVILESNGYLINKEMAAKIVATGIEEIRISLYSFDPAIHNSLRQIPWAHEKAKEAILDLAEAKQRQGSQMKICLGVLLNEKNIGEDAKKLVSFARANGFFVNIQALDENFKGDYAQENWFINDPLWPQKPEAVKDFFNWLIKQKRNGALITNSVKNLLSFEEYFLNPGKTVAWPCHLAYRTFNFDPAGRPFFCYKTGITFASLKDKAPEELWRSANLENKRCLVKNCSKICRLRAYYRDNLVDKIKG